MKQLEFAARYEPRWKDLDAALAEAPRHGGAGGPVSLARFPALHLAAGVLFTFTSKPRATPSQCGRCAAAFRIVARLNVRQDATRCQQPRHPCEPRALLYKHVEQPIVPAHEGSLLGFHRRGAYHSRSLGNSLSPEGALA